MSIKDKLLNGDIDAETYEFLYDFIKPLIKEVQDLQARVSALEPSIKEWCECGNEFNNGICDACGEVQ